MIDLSGVTAAAVTYGDQRAAEQKALDDAALAAVQAEFDAYRKANPVPVKPVEPVLAPTLVVGGAFGSNADPKPLEARAARKFGSRRTYHSADVAPVVKTIQANIAAGRKVSHVSMKQADWAGAAKGSSDAWAKATAAAIQKAIAGTDHLVRFAINHEPENDGGGAAARDNWKAMQARLSKFFDVPGIQFVVVLMGYHQFSKNSALYPLWNLDACVPLDASVKGVGYDLYERNQVEGSTKWTNWAGYLAQIQLWHTAHKKAWGLSEVGIAPAAFALDPAWFTKMKANLAKYGGTWFDYFNTNLNSVAEWEFSPEADKNKLLKAGDPREAAFVKLLTA